MFTPDSSPYATQNSKFGFAIIVIGASGMMAAGRAAECGAKVLLN